MQRYTTEFVTSHMARTTPRSREDLVQFVFKLNQFPHAFVKLNHFSNTSSPRDSDDGGQLKRQAYRDEILLTAIVSECCHPSQPLRDVYTPSRCFYISPQLSQTKRKLFQGYDS